MRMTAIVFLGLVVLVESFGCLALLVLTLWEAIGAKWRHRLAFAWWWARKVPLFERPCRVWCASCKRERKFWPPDGPAYCGCGRCEPGGGIWP